MVRVLRENAVMSYILLVARLYLGWAWLTAGWEKVIGDFDATGFLKSAIERSAGDHPAVQGWWATFLENVALPYVGFFNFLVAWGGSVRWHRINFRGLYNFFRPYGHCDEFCLFVFRND